MFEAVALEVAHDETRVGGVGDGVVAGGLEPFIEFSGEGGVGEFALAVGGPAVVLFFAHEVVEVECAAEGGAAGGVVDAGLGGVGEDVDEVAGEGEVGEVVDAELGFEAVFGELVGDGHEAGVVEEDIEAVVFGFESIGERFDGGEAGVIEGHDSDLGLGSLGEEFDFGLFGFGHIAAGHDDGGAFGGVRFG